MAAAWRDWGAVVAAFFLALPVAFAVAWAFAGLRRCRGMPDRLARRHSLAEVGAVVGTLPWLWMVLTPRPAPRDLALVPLRDLAAVLVADPSTALAQIGGNLLVFAALGLCAPVRFAALAGVGRLLVLGVAGSVMIETIQYSLHLGRVSSIDDVILNAVGAVLGGLASRRWWASPDRTVALRPTAHAPIGDAIRR